MDKIVKIVAKNSEQVIKQVSCSIIALAKQSIKDTGKFSIALSGGNTPKLLYQYLKAENLFGTIDTSKVFIYFSDERYVPENDQRSNFGLARDYLLNNITIPSENVFAVDTSFENPVDSAIQYQQLICKNLNNSDTNIPEFDLIILGMGTDGHTASLFPDSELIKEDKLLVASCFHSETNTSRITFTFQLINAAKNIYILAIGKEKYTILNDINNLDKDSIIKYPIQQVKPTKKLIWYTDNAAMTGK